MPMFSITQGIERLRRLCVIIVGRDGPLCLWALQGRCQERRQPGREPATNHLTSLHHLVLADADLKVAPQGRAANTGAVGERRTRVVYCFVISPAFLNSVDFSRILHAGVSAGEIVAGRVVAHLPRQLHRAELRSHRAEAGDLRVGGSVSSWYARGDGVHREVN